MTTPAKKKKVRQPGLPKTGGLARQLAVNVERRRRILDLSRAEVSRRAGLGQGVVYAIVNQIHSPRLATIERIAHALEIADPTELLLDMTGEE